jgi:hypothetical protein
MTSKNNILMDILTYYCQKSGHGTTLPTFLSARFYFHYRPPEVSRTPRRLWSAVRHGASLYSDRFLVPGCGEWGGGGFKVRPGLSLFLCGWLVLHRSGQVPKTGRLYSSVTHHKRNTLHIPGSSYLHLVGLLLLVRK